MRTISRNAAVGVANGVAAELDAAGYALSMCFEKTDNDAVTFSVLCDGSSEKFSVNVTKFLENCEEGTSYNDAVCNITRKVIAQILVWNNEDADSDIDGLRKTYEKNLKSTANFCKMLDVILVTEKTFENLDTASSLPCKRYGDLVLLVVCHPTGNSRRDSFLVTKRMAVGYRLTDEDLFAIALANASKKLPVSMRPMSNILKCKDDAEMLVVSNEDMAFGASALFYPGVLKQIANRFQDSFWVIPSSIHEVICVADGSAPWENCRTDIEDLNNMIFEINKQLYSGEILSVHAYHYDAKTEKFETTEQYLARANSELF